MVDYTLKNTQGYPEYSKIIAMVDSGQALKWFALLGDFCFEKEFYKMYSKSFEKCKYLFFSEHYIKMYLNGWIKFNLSIKYTYICTYPKDPN